MSVVGVGTDAVDIARARDILDRHGERATRRFLTDLEAHYVNGSALPARHFASRLAAKEATYKALQSLPGARGIGWLDIEVIRDDEGAPSLQLHGLAARVAAQAPGLIIHLSLTHSDHLAVAVAVAEQRTSNS